MTIQVTSDIPVPAPRATHQSYPWTTMEVGDSFAVSAERAHSVRVNASAWVRNNKSTMRFTVRRHGDAYRCWRIA